MKIIPVVVFLLDFWLNVLVLDLKNAKHLKREKWRVNVNSVTF